MIVSGIMGIFGVVLLIYTIQDWMADEQRFATEKARLEGELNTLEEQAAGVASVEQPKDFHCFQSPYSYMEDNQSVYVYSEVRMDACTENSTAYYQKYDILTLDPVADDQRTYKTEYHLLNGTTLIFS